MEKVNPKLLFIADVPGWIFHRHCLTLQKYLGDIFDISISFRGEDYDESLYDLIYPLEFNMVDQVQIHDPSKYVTGIRSTISWMDWDFLELISYLKRNFKLIHVVSRQLYDIFQPFIEVHYVSHGVDIDYFTPIRNSKPFRKKMVIGWAGNKGNPFKGFENYILPLAQISDVEVLYCSFAEQNYSIEKMREFYESIDVYVCASSLNEGNNNSLLEAASMGKAIVTTINGTVPEYLINRKNALLVERKIEIFSQAIEELKDNLGLRVELGKNAREAVISSGWHWQIKAKEYEQFFKIALDLKDYHAQPLRNGEIDFKMYAAVLKLQYELEREARTALAVRVYKQTAGKEILASLEEKSNFIMELETYRDFLQSELEKKNGWITELETYRDFLQSELEKKNEWITELEMYRGFIQSELEKKNGWITELETYRDRILKELVNKETTLKRIEAFWLYRILNHFNVAYKKLSRR